LSDPHGVRLGSASTVAPASARSIAAAAGIVDLERDADVARDASPDLDLVDECGMARIGELEGRPPCLEDRDPTVVGGECPELT
jgi:hypothetical protein